MNIIVLTERGDNYSNTVDSAIIQALGGNDTIINSGSNVSIEGNKGNDLISLGSDAQNNFINYTTGDGLDTIDGFNATSKLNISEGIYNSLTSGNDVIITVGDGSILLKDAATLSAINVDGTLADGQIARSYRRGY